MRRITAPTVTLCLGLVAALHGCGAAACGAAAPEAAAPEAAAPEAAAPEPTRWDSLGGIDAIDRCSVVGEACLEGFDGSDDGCPDPSAPALRFGEGSSRLEDNEDGTRVLGDVCIDGRRLWPGATLRLVAVSPELGPERVAEVRARLIACGVSDSVLREGGPLPAPQWESSAEQAHAYPPTSVVVVAENCAL